PIPQIGRALSLSTGGCCRRVRSLPAVAVLGEERVQRRDVAGSRGPHASVVGGAGELALGKQPVDRRPSFPALAQEALIGRPCGQEAEPLGGVVVEALPPLGGVST